MAVMVKKFENAFTRFDTLHERDRRIDAIVERECIARCCHQTTHSRSINTFAQPVRFLLLFRRVSDPKSKVSSQSLGDLGRSRFCLGLGTKVSFTSFTPLSVIFTCDLCKQHERYRPLLQCAVHTILLNLFSVTLCLSDKCTAKLILNLTVKTQ